MASIFSNKAIVSLHTSYNCLRVLLFSAKHFLTFKSVIALSHFHLAHESQLSLNKEKILSQKFYFTEIYFLFVRGMNRETPSLKLYNGSIPMDHSIPKSWQDKMHRLVWQATHTQSLNSTIQRWRKLRTAANCPWWWSAAAGDGWRAAGVADFSAGTLPSLMALGNQPSGYTHIQTHRRNRQADQRGLSDHDSHWQTDRNTL